MSPSQSEGSIYISSIALNVRQQFGKTVDHIIFQTETGSFKKEIPVEVSPGHEHKEVFDPDLKLSPRDRPSVSIQYRSQQRRRHTLTITVELSEVMTEAQDDGHGKQTYFKFHDNIEVAIGVSCYSGASESSQDAPLPATTSEILSMCPRFRLLIIGNSGVGKSSMVQKVFGIKDVDVSDCRRGQADIDREFIAADNGLFVLHDSLGLEAGENDNIDKVKHFIRDRQGKENLKDRLHAVWVCLAVPYAKGRFLEAGIEEFLRERKKILGDIPVIVVLTQLDLLERSLLLKLRCEGVMVKRVEEAKPILEPRRSKFLDNYCIQPLLRAVQGDILHVAVSTESGFGLEPTISELLQITTSEIERYIRADPSHAVVTERPNIKHRA